MFGHCCSPKSGVFAHTSWVWWEEERSLPPQLGHRTFALEQGARWSHSATQRELEMGSLLLLPAAGNEGSVSPRG